MCGLFIYFYVCFLLYVGGRKFVIYRLIVHELFNRPWFNQVQQKCRYLFLSRPKWCVEFLLRTKTFNFVLWSFSNFVALIYGNIVHNHTLIFFGGKQRLGNVNCYDSNIHQQLPVYIFLLVSYSYLSKFKSSHHDTDIQNLSFGDWAI